MRIRRAINQSKGTRKMAAILYQHHEVFEGFTISFEALPELESIQDLCAGMDEPEWAAAGIRDGRTVLFVARVTARRAGVELAETFLGGCVYTTYADFIEGGGYYDDMRREVVTTAKVKIQILQIPDGKRVGVKA